MSNYVLDTMTLILKLEKRKMPLAVKEKFEEIEKGNGSMSIPSIVFAEIAYLNEKGKIDTDLMKVLKYMNSFSNVNEHPISYDTINGYSGDADPLFR